MKLAEGIVSRSMLQREIAAFSSGSSAEAAINLTISTGTVKIGFSESVGLEQ